MVHYTKEQRAKMLNEARQRLTQALSTEPKSIRELQKNKVITRESLASLTFIMPNLAEDENDRLFLRENKK